MQVFLQHSGGVSRGPMVDPPWIYIRNSMEWREKAKSLRQGKRKCASHEWCLGVCVPKIPYYVLFPIAYTATFYCPPVAVTDRWIDGGRMEGSQKLPTQKSMVGSTVDPSGVVEFLLLEELRWTSCKNLNICLYRRQNLQIDEFWKTLWMNIPRPVFHAESNGVYRFSIWAFVVEKNDPEFGHVGKNRLFSWLSFSILAFRPGSG